MDIKEEDFTGGFTEIAKPEPEPEHKPEPKPVVEKETLDKPLVNEIKKHTFNKFKMIFIVILFLLINLIYYEPWFLSYMHKMIASILTSIMLVSIIVFL